MTMPNEMPYRSAEEACLAAQGTCIRERGSFCEAYDGVSCKTCPKHEEGIKRREKRYTQEKKQAIRSVVSQDGNTIRLRKVNNDFLFEVGKFFDSPPLFIPERSILIYRKEMALTKELLSSVRV